MKTLLIISILFITSCTCVTYETKDVSASYCSTKEFEHVTVENGELLVDIQGVTNDADKVAGKIAEGAVRGALSK